MPVAVFREMRPVLGEMPRDVNLISLHPHSDSRGTFTEIFRDAWLPDVHPIQWNVVHSEGEVMRGVHVHLRHFDYLTVAFGRLQLGLCDLRADSPTFRSAAMIELAPGQAISIPPRVAHGFYFPVPSIHIYAVSEYWDTGDELGCLWSDPELGIPWDFANPLVSARDAGLPSLDRLLEKLA